MRLSSEWPRRVCTSGYPSGPSGAGRKRILCTAIRSSDRGAALQSSIRARSGLDAGIRPDFQCAIEGTATSSRWKHYGLKKRQGWRNWIVRIGPVPTAQVVQSNDKPQTLRDRGDHENRHRTEEERSLNPGMGAEPEVDGGDRDGNRNPIPDDPESPRVAGIPLIDESALRASIAARQPSIEHGSPPTVRARLPEPVLDREPRLEVLC